VIKAPPDVNEAKLRKFVEKKRVWVYTKLSEKDRFNRAASPKEFVDGEGFLYLGRSYRIKLVDDQDAPRMLNKGRFMLRKRDLPEAKQNFIRGYNENAKHGLGIRTKGYKIRMQVVLAGVKVQDLGYHWGACGKGDWLYFHWKIYSFLLVLLSM
jgi:predicted metal-dependent hydrolase